MVWLSRCFGFSKKLKANQRDQFPPKCFQESSFGVVQFSQQWCCGWLSIGEFAKFTHLPLIMSVRFFFPFSPSRDTLPPPSDGRATMMLGSPAAPRRALPAWPAAPPRGSGSPTPPSRPHLHGSIAGARSSPPTATFSVPAAARQPLPAWPAAPPRDSGGPSPPGQRPLPACSAAPHCQCQELPPICSLFSSSPGQRRQRLSSPG